MRWFFGVMAVAALAAVLIVLRVAAFGAAVPARRTVALQPGAIENIEFSVIKGRNYGLLVSVPDISALGRDDLLGVAWRDPSGSMVEKSLHSGDADLYVTVRPERSGKAVVRLDAEHLAGPLAGVEVELIPIPAGKSAIAQLGAASHASWRDAQPIELGSTVFATADDRSYIPSLGTPGETFAQMLGGIHWYRFDYAGPGDKLIHINIEMLDRDVPVDVAIFTIQDGKPLEYTRGIERFEPEKSTILHGLYKFLPRVLPPGTYYLRVMGNHPAYQLETELYPLPPYRDPRQAVRVAMDYIVRKGDSWHANVPRRGVVALRTSNPVQETRLCIACHPTHFSTRAEMIAVENGYPVRARPSLQFLIERLSNNPRPLYGDSDASWARMIHAPGNVLSRLAYIVGKFDNEISGERREELYRGIRDFLELYWPGVAQPQPESNGNLPRISGYEVAHHSAVLFGDYYQRTGQAKYQALRHQTEQVLLAGEPADMLDLAWQTVALAELGPGKYRDKIKANVERIFSHQKRDGAWAMPFDMEIVEYDWGKHVLRKKKIPPRPGKGAQEEGPRRSEFQTYHTLYALAKAGLTTSDPRMRQVVEYCLSRQTPSGAWQGSPDYKNFDTPFRDTQYAIMALSELFPGPNARSGSSAIGGVKGWNAGFPKPSTDFGEHDIPATLHALNMHWDRPSDGVVAAIAKLLDSKHVLVRFQAAVALGRFADAGSIHALSRRLGDRSKIVQRGAAWALRQIGSRKPAANGRLVAAVRRALRASDGRTRWGAARIFNQHFKYLTGEWRLGRELVRMVWHEPVPSVRMQAVQALYQWWFWDRDAGHRKEIELALINGLGREAHPWVRRNLIEAYYNTLDDNLRYLYRSWMVRVKRDEDRDEIQRGHRETVLAQAARFRDAMVGGNALARDGLLRSLYTHVLREGLGDISRLDGAPLPETVTGPWVSGYKWFAVYDPLSAGTGARAKAGNDSEAPKFYDDSAPLINEALLTTLSSDTPDLALATAKALRFLDPFPIDARLAERLLDLAAFAPPAIRGEIARISKVLLPKAETGSPEVTSQLSRILAEGDAIAVDVAAAVLSAGPQRPLVGRSKVQAALRARMETTTPEDPAFAHLVRALSASPGLREERKSSLWVAGGFSSSRAAARLASLAFVLDVPRAFSFGALRDAYQRQVSGAEPEQLIAALGLLGTLDYKNDRYAPSMARIRSLLLTAMHHSGATVRSAALSAMRTIGPLREDPDLLTRLAKLLDDPDRDVRNSALALRASLDARAGREHFDTRQLLDYEYFKVRVQTILAKKGADGLACVNCHANHTIFKLIEPDQYGVLNESQIRTNYSSAIGVVNVAEPESSLLLNKPISDEDAAGIGNSQRFSHGGDLRWLARKNSPEYRTILRWIQGERLGSDETAASEE